MQQWLALVISTLITAPLWIVIHEMSHILAAKQIAPVKDIKLWLYPHRDEEGKFYFARVRWSWDPWPVISDFVLAMVYLAPRIPDLFATLMFPYGFLFSNPWCYVWYIFWAGGLIDLFVGSLGIRKYSDLQIASKFLKLNPWIFRTVGFTLVLISAIIGLVRYF